VEFNGVAGPILVIYPRLCKQDRAHRQTWRRLRDDLSGDDDCENPFCEYRGGAL